MDNSRVYDLKALHERFNNASLSMSKRLKAYRKYQLIQSKLKDRTLTKLRYRLVKAHNANDVHETLKLEEQLVAYTRHAYGEAPSQG